MITLATTKIHIPYRIVTIPVTLGTVARAAAAVVALARILAVATVLASAPADMALARGAAQPAVLLDIFLLARRIIGRITAARHKRCGNPHAA